MITKSNNIRQLSFTDHNENYWAPARTGDYGVDCETGRQAALELLDFMRRNEAPIILGYVMAAISRAMGGELGAVEVAFFHQIARHAMAIELECESPLPADVGPARPLLRLVFSEGRAVGAG